MFNSIILAAAIVTQCSGGSCGGGGCGSYYGGGNYYMGSCAGGSCGRSYSGGGCVNGSCDSGYYYGGVQKYYGANSTTLRLTNVGSEYSRSYIKAVMPDNRHMNIPVINGKLPTVTCYGNTYVLDYGQDYVCTAEYKTVYYTTNLTTTSKAKKSKGPAALKNYDAVKTPEKASDSKKGPSGLKHPDALENQKTVSDNFEDDDKLPSSILSPSRPSDTEVDQLLK